MRNEDGQYKLGDVVIPYAETWQDADPEFKFIRPQFNVVAFITQEAMGTCGTPTLFFVPKGTPLPDAIARGVLHGYYNDGTETAQLEDWLKRHAEFTLQADAAVVAMAAPE